MTKKNELNKVNTLINDRENKNPNEEWVETNIGAALAAAAAAAASLQTQHRHALQCCSRSARNARRLGACTASTGVHAG